MEQKITKKESRTEEYTRLRELSKTQKLNSKEKIFIKSFELEKLKEDEKKEADKRKKNMIKGINKIINVEIDKKYIESKDKNLDLKITSVLLYALENFDDLLGMVSVDEYIERNRRGGIVRKNRLKKIGENENGNNSSHS